MKPTYVIAAAWVAALIVAMPSLSLQVQARAPVPGAKSGRTDGRPHGTACSKHEWPYFEPACLRDARNPFGEARQVRTVAIDRLP